jgi:hypothetical protein
MTNKIVVQDIPFGSAHAYRRGDQITDEAVKENGWEDYVASRDSEAARKVLADIVGEDALPKPTTRAPRAPKTTKTAEAAPADGNESGEDQ